LLNRAYDQGDGRQLGLAVGNFIFVERKRLKIIYVVVINLNLSCSKFCFFNFALFFFFKYFTSFVKDCKIVFAGDTPEGPTVNYFC
jgi:hypothetical protein